MEVFSWIPNGFLIFWPPAPAATTPSDRLTQEGYTQLHEADAWTLTAGGKYFVTRNGSSLLAFRVPAGAPAYRYSV